MKPKKATAPSDSQRDSQDLEYWKNEGFKIWSDGKVEK